MAGDAQKPVRSRIVRIGMVTRAYPAAVPEPLRDGLAGAIAVGCVKAHSGEQAGRRCGGGL